MSRVILIVQARMGSTRLPGKSLLLLAGAPLLQRMLERVTRCSFVDKIVVATTTLKRDDAIVALARDHGYAFFRGSENDLVDRYYQAALAHHGDIIVRVPGDNATPEPETIDATIRYHVASSNDFTSSYPDVIPNGFPDGIGAEVFGLTPLSRIWADQGTSRNREHPHTNFYDHPERFKIGSPPCPPAIRRPEIKLDVNTPDQYAFMARLYADLYPRDPRFGIRDIIEWYDTQFFPTTARGGWHKGLP
jgi:spore coat polysaccharide biosynthesis protein SpsF